MPKKRTEDPREDSITENSKEEPITEDPKENPKEESKEDPINNEVRKNSITEDPKKDAVDKNIYSIEILASIRSRYRVGFFVTYNFRDFLRKCDI